MSGLLDLPMLTLAAIASTAAAGQIVPAQPAANVEPHSVSHRGERVVVRVPRTATYVGAERFALYGVADAEIHVFVEADARRRASKLYWIQFESYLPANDHRYNYAEGNRRATLWGTTTWVGGGPRRTVSPSRPASDRESVMRILARGGYTLPAETIAARLVQILDDPTGTGRGRRELMLIYSEDLAPTGQSYAALVADGKTTPAWDPFEQPLIDRAAKAFTVERR